MELRADLHIHTTASDGLLTPAQAVEAACRVGLGALAITDHDSVGGIEEALAAGAARDIEVVPGVEISATWNQATEVHILGYFVDHRDLRFLEWLRVLTEARRKRGEEMVGRLNAAGVPVSFERVEQIAAGGAIGRPHVARAICETGAAYSMDAAFGRYLCEGCPGYVPRYKVTPHEAVRAIMEASGAACCAHVGKLNREDLVIEMASQGLSGIEVYHPDHPRSATSFYSRFAARHGLIATGGSDAHCFDNDRYCGIGEITVDRDVVEQLRHAAGRAGRADNLR